MKKGSSVRKCWNCKRNIFWVIPTGKTPMGIFREVTNKDIYPWNARTQRYLCVDCYEQGKKDGRIIMEGGYERWQDRC